MLKVVSWGMGVQSTCFPYMMQDGLLDRCDLVAVGDTGSERPESLELIKVVKPMVEGMGIDFRIARSHLGKLHEYYEPSGS